MAVGVELIARYKPGENVAVYATGANINAGRFIVVSGKNTKGAYIGAHAGAGIGPVFGVSERDAIAGVTDHRGGTNCARRGAIARVVAGAAVAVGAGVQSDATGRAITLAAGVRLGTALSAAAAAGDVIEVDLA